MAEDDHVKLPDINDPSKQTVQATRRRPTIIGIDDSGTIQEAVLPTDGGDDDDPPPSMPNKKEEKGMTLWDKLSRASESDTSTSSKPKPRRFLRLARMVRTNLQWAHDMHNKHEEEPMFVVKNVGGDQTEPLTFNVANFRVSHKTYGGLSTRVRRLLHKHPFERSQSDLRVLTDVIARLKCFSKYSTAAKRELAGIIFYDSFDDGRVVIQEGHVGVSFYFIVSGTVVIKVQETEKATGRRFNQYVGELAEGSSFGELALLHNIKRTATIICKGPCEFLRVDKDDFVAVLKNVTTGEYHARLIFLRDVALFNDWSDQELRAINNMCRNSEYPANHVILRYDQPQNDNVFFVFTGECYIVREVILIREPMPFGGVKLLLPTDQQLKAMMVQTEMEDRRVTVHNRRPDRRLWTVCVLGRGSYFGVGENMDSTYIITKTKAELIQVPKILFAKYGRSKTLDSMRDNINRWLPDNRVLYQTYFSHQKWNKYKKRVVDEIIQRQAVATKSKPSDVPLVVRLENSMNVNYA